MPPTLDVYKSWLGITIPDRPLTHYQLLRLDKFEDDPAKIRTHYRKMNTYVRKFSAGEFAKQSQDLLNELAKAMLCLTDQGRKAEYDAALGREVAASTGKRRGMEALLIARKVLDPAQLEKAKKYAGAVGVDLRDALVQQKLAAPEVATQIYAESLGLPFLDLSETPPDPFLIPRVPALLARQHSCVPVMIDDDVLIMASPHPLKPDVEEEMRLRLNYPVRCALCTVADAQVVIDQHYTKEAAAAEMVKGGPAAKGGGPAQPAVEVDAWDPEVRAATRRRRLMAGVVAFNFTFMALMGSNYVLQFTSFAKGLGLALGVGAAVGGIVFGMMTLLKK